MTPLFPSLFEEILFWVIFLGAPIGRDLFRDLYVSRSFRGSVKQSVKIPERNNLRRFLPALMLCVFVVPIVIAYLAIGILASWRWLFYPGLVLWVAGWLFTCWPILTLGRFASRSSFTQVQILSDHRVVEKGPYQFIRHPIYAGTLVAFIGLGLALQSWIVLLYVLIIASTGIFVLIRFEERFMVAELGDQYMQYKMRTTKCLIPYVW